MTKTADAIGLAALRSPAPRGPVPVREKEQPHRRRRRRLKLRFGRLMFTAAIVYLIGAGAIGELQLLHVKQQEQATIRKLQSVKAHTAKLQQNLNQLSSPAGESQAVRSTLHYAPAGTTSVQVTVQK